MILLCDRIVMIRLQKQLDNNCSAESFTLSSMYYIKNHKNCKNTNLRIWYGLTCFMKHLGGIPFFPPPPPPYFR